MTHDADLIAALRKCWHCDGKGHTEDPKEWRCPHCRLARMAADRIEKKNEVIQKLKGWFDDSCAREIAERVRERCPRECEYPLVTGWKCAHFIRALTVEELLKETRK